MSDGIAFGRVMAVEAVAKNTELEASVSDVHDLGLVLPRVVAEGEEKVLAATAGDDFKVKLSMLNQFF